MESSITITFNNTPSVGDYLSVFVDTGAGVIELKETFVNLRQSPKQVTTPDYIAGGDLTDALTNFRIAWNLDYKNTGGSNNISANQGFGTPDEPSSDIIITLQNEAWQFDRIEGRLIDNGTVTVNLLNQPPQAVKEITLDGLAATDNPCETLEATFSAVGGDSDYRLYLNGSLTLSGASPMTIEVNRGSNYNISITDSIGTDIGSYTLRVPRKLIPNDIVVGVENYESGASVTVNPSFVSNSILPLEYSLDGVDYQEQNLYSGLPDGDYTIHVKDAFGCVTTKDFVVDGVTSLTETVFTISEINALRFAKAEEGKKNLKNTLSCNENKKLTYPFYHTYLENDVIRTQFKTNAKNISVYTISGEQTAPLTVIKQTENIGLEAKSTATYFSLGGGRSGIYFGAVDVLDPITSQVQESIDLGFSLPEWANTKGQLVSVEGVGQLPISEIGYSDFYDSFILEFDVNYTGEPLETTLSSTYNLQPYEVYEFDTIVDKDLFNVVIEADEFAYVSEKIKIVKDSDDLFEITYTDPQNKGNMVYQTGIVHKLRLKGLSDYLGEQETEGYNGDKGYHVTDNSVFSSEHFIFPRLSSAMAHKLRLVMAHTILNINGVMYKLAEPPEINTDINNNFKTFLVVLKSGGDLFLDSSQEIIGGSAENESLSGALEASKGKSLLLWTKN